MATPRILMFGDSHVHAMQEALKARGERGTGVPIEVRRLLKAKLGPGAPVSLKSQIDRFRRRFLKMEGGGQASNQKTTTITLGDTTFPAFLTIAKTLRTTDILVSAVGGGKHAVFSTIQHPVPFDFHFPEDGTGTLKDGAELIPYKPLAEHFESELWRTDGATLAALKKASVARVVHLMAPPPKRDGSFIQRHHDTYFAAANIGALGVSDPSLRMKFWELQYRILREMCAELKIELLAPPEEACDEDGFLDKVFYAQDATHANKKYGELVIAQLEDLAASNKT